MKKWIAIALSAVMLLGILSGCKKEELDLTPDDKMTIAICALARSVKAQKEGVKPTQYTVKGVRTLDGEKTMESTASYDTEKAITVVENRYFEGDTQIGTETVYTFILSHLGAAEESFEIISAKVTTENEETTKQYSILYTADTPQDAENAWIQGKYGADMAYQTYGRLEDLIVSAAMSQGGVEAKVTSAKDYTLSITGDVKTERYTVENDRITKFVWTEMTTNGEDESTWEYFWGVSDIANPNLDLTDGWVLVTE